MRGRHLLWSLILMVGCAPSLENVDRDSYEISEQVYPFKSLEDSFAVRFSKSVAVQDLTFSRGDVAWAYRSTGLLAAANLYGPHHLMGHMWPAGTTVEFQPDGSPIRFRTPHLARLRDVVCEGPQWIDASEGKLVGCTLAENYQWGATRNFVAKSRVRWHDNDEDAYLEVILALRQQFGQFGFQKGDTVRFRRDASLSSASVTSARVLPNIRCGPGVWIFESDQKLIECPDP